MAAGEDTGTTFLTRKVGPKDTMVYTEEGKVVPVDEYESERYKEALMAGSQPGTKATTKKVVFDTQNNSKSTAATGDDTSDEDIDKLLKSSFLPKEDKKDIREAKKKFLLGSESEGDFSVEEDPEDTTAGGNGPKKSTRGRKTQGKAKAKARQSAPGRNAAVEKKDLEIKELQKKIDEMNDLVKKTNEQVQEARTKLDATADEAAEWKDKHDKCFSASHEWQCNFEEASRALEAKTKTIEELGKLSKKLKPSTVAQQVQASLTHTVERLNEALTNCSKKEKLIEEERAKTDKMSHKIDEKANEVKEIKEELDKAQKNIHETDKLKVVVEHDKAKLEKVVEQQGAEIKTAAKNLEGANNKNAELINKVATAESKLSELERKKVVAEAVVKEMGEKLEEARNKVIDLEQKAKNAPPGVDPQMEHFRQLAKVHLRRDADTCVATGKHVFKEETISRMMEIPLELFYAVGDGNSVCRSELAVLKTYPREIVALAIANCYNKRSFLYSDRADFSDLCKADVIPNEPPQLKNLVNALKSKQRDAYEAEFGPGLDANLKREVIAKSAIAFADGRKNRLSLNLKDFIFEAEKIQAHCVHTIFDAFPRGMCVWEQVFGSHKGIRPVYFSAMSCWAIAKEIFEMHAQKIKTINDAWRLGQRLVQESVKLLKEKAEDIDSAAHKLKDTYMTEALKFETSKAFIEELKQLVTNAVVAMPLDNVEGPTMGTVLKRMKTSSKGSIPSLLAPNDTEDTLVCPPADDPNRQAGQKTKKGDRQHSKHQAMLASTCHGDHKEWMTRVPQRQIRPARGYQKCFLCQYTRVNLKAGDIKNQCRRDDCRWGIHVFDAARKHPKTVTIQQLKDKKAVKYDYRLSHEQNLGIGRDTYHKNGEVFPSSPPGAPVEA